MKKLTAALILLAMMCTMLCVCQPDEKDPLDNDIKPSTEITDKNETTESDPLEGVGTADPGQDTSPISVDIETIGGAVIVGKIASMKKDGISFLSSR